MNKNRIKYFGYLLPLCCLTALSSCGYSKSESNYDYDGSTGLTENMIDYYFDNHSYSIYSYKEKEDGYIYAYDKLLASSTNSNWTVQFDFNYQYIVSTHLPNDDYEYFEENKENILNEFTNILNSNASLLESTYKKTFTFKNDETTETISKTVNTNTEEKVTASLVTEYIQFKIYYENRVSRYFYISVPVETYICPVIEKSSLIQDFKTLEYTNIREFKSKYHFIN